MDRSGNDDIYLARVTTAGLVQDPTGIVVSAGANPGRLAGPRGERLDGDRRLARQPQRHARHSSPPGSRPPESSLTAPASA